MGSMRLFRMELLVWWTLLGVALGSALGAGLYNVRVPSYVVELIGYPGELFIRALQALVLPLILFALMSGVFSLRHSTGGGVGRVTRWSLMYYLLSMILAVALGIILVYLIKPGRDKPFDNASFARCSAKQSTSDVKSDGSTLTSLLNIGRDMLPKNLVNAAAQSNYLGIITFSIIFAFVVNTFGERAQQLVDMIELNNEVIIKIIFGIVRFTPIGVASLIAGTILKACDILFLLKALGLYIVTVMSGLIIHTFIILPITMIVLCRHNPIKVFKAFIPALCMGFGTSSSAATMPLTMQCGENYGCDRNIVQFVVPLGTNINRDGTALYEAIAAIFICQAHGVHLPLGNVIVIAITSTLAAIGAASIPNGALVTMVTVLQAIDLPQFIGDVSILYAVDWFLGTFRTSVNIWGDACACVIVDTWAKNFETKQDIVDQNVV